MDDPTKRGDLSRFLVHLCRKTLGINAEDNLINILKTKKIEARNHHCLFSPKIKKSNMSKKLINQFKTVCLTETPINQIQKLAAENYPRKIKLKPYGIAFWRSELLDEGANPAIYLNAGGTTLRDYLLSEFDKHFKKTNLYHTLKKKEDFYKEIVQYYSLINIIRDDHDFSWEREWRYPGDLKFGYNEISAIVALNPDAFIEKCKSKLSKTAMSYIDKTPIIDPKWNYEEVIEAISIKLWNLK